MEAPMKKENKNPEGMIKTDINTEKKAYVYRFPRKLKVKVLSITAALGLTLSATFGFAACDFTKPNTPVDPEKPNPIQPVDPEKPGPEKPDDPTTPVDPEEPDDPTKPVDPEKPDPDNPNPDNPDPDKPDVDYDKLTPETLTAEQKATMVKNVTTALATNIQKSVGRKDGVVNKIIALDFEKNSQEVKLLLDYTNSSIGNQIGLFNFALSTDANYKNFITNEITPTNNNMGITLISFSTQSNDDRAKESLNKLSPSINTQDLDFDNIVNTTGPTLSIGGTNTIIIYTINKQQITKTSTYARSDGNITDVIEQSILQGEEGKTYTTPETEIYKFSNNSLYDFNGLEKGITDKKTAAAYNFTVDNKTSQYIRNRKYFLLEEENQN